ncbi:unnamed protein product [Cyprideis torosa]|uniref:Uncharacterized protein n=1 Tax=Cyprideis torosa TaxID=163714 RepID=A0A7R8ZV78_9CRUS|nr:unnamed protein product [Cyprideis torosa]CAG0909897.1 unnamed protein product [Cyprideis torosa]
MNKTVLFELTKQKKDPEATMKSMSANGDVSHSVSANGRSAVAGTGKVILGFFVVLSAVALIFLIRGGYKTMLRRRDRYDFPPMDFRYQHQTQHLIY